MEKVEEDRIRRLPAGLHGIPREVVERNQRERLIAAMAEVCAEKGYAGVSVADVTRQAAVSTASFYRQFADKRECMLASFEELFGRLLEALERACESETGPPAKVKAALGTAVELLGADLPTARLLSVEIVAVGEKGVRLQHAAIERLAALLRQARGVASSASPDAEWAAAAAVVALTARRVVRGEKPVASELEAALA